MITSNVEAHSAKEEPERSPKEWVYLNRICTIEQRLTDFYQKDKSGVMHRIRTS